MSKITQILLAASCLSVCFATPSPVFADVKSDVGTYVAQASASEKSEEVEKAVSKAPPGQVLAALRQHLQSSNERAQFEAVSLTGKTGRRSSELAVRRQATGMLLEVVLNNPDTANASSAVGNLRMFISADYTDDMRQALYARMLSQKENPRRVLEETLLAGVMQIPLSMDLLRQFALTLPAADFPPNLALARMGDQQAIQRLIAKVESEPNMTARVTGLLRHYSYARQPQTVEQLVKYLFNDERLPLYGVPNTGERIATRAATELRGIIAGFPDTLFITPEQKIAEARKWVLAQGGAANLKIKR